MKEDKSKSQAIDDYINSAKTTAEVGRKMKVLLKGTYTEFEVYRFPITLLRFNLDNTRFEVQKLAYEKQYGQIDQDKKSGKEAITRLLLYDNNGVILSKDAKALLTDIERNGQLEPGVITWDGYVINGNRRLASLSYLFDKKSEQRYEYFNAVRLPKGTNEEDYFKIEADLQWATDLKVDYNPVNNYLMLKHAIEYKMTLKEIAHLTRKTEKDIKRELAELALVEDYLKTTKDPKDFSQVLGQTELLTDAAKQVVAYEQAREKPSVIAEYKKLIFVLVNINRKKSKTVTYRDIRTLNKAFKKDDKRVMSVYKRIKLTDDPATIKKSLTTGLTKFQVHTIKEKPDRLGEDLLYTAKKIFDESRTQQISSKSKHLIEKSILLLKKALS